MAGPKFKNAAQNRRAPSCVADLEGVAVDGATTFFESRISFGGMFFPLRLPIVPVIRHAGMASVEACLVKKHIKPAFLPGHGKLVVLNPFDQSVKPAIGFFCRIRAARHGFRSKQAGVPINIRRKKFFRLAFHTGRATAPSPAATEVRVSRPLRTAGTFFLHALM